MISGDRARFDFIKNKEKEASVEASFDLTKYAPHIIEAINSFGVDIDDEDELIIKRVLTINKKNRIYINGSMFNLSILSTISSMLFNVSSQREYNLLLNKKSYLNIIDNYSDLDNKVSLFRESFNILKKKKKKLNSLHIHKKELIEKREFYLFMLKEIDKVTPVKGELKKVENELELLENSEELKKIYKNMIDKIGGNRDSAYYIFTDIIRNINKYEKFIPNEIVSNINEIYYSIENLNSDIQKLYDEVDIDFDKLTTISDRYHELISIYKKYGGNEEMFFARYEEIKNQIYEVDQIDKDIDLLNKNILKLEETLNIEANEIEAIRIKHSKILSDEITEILNDLDMKEAVLNIEVQRDEELNENGYNKIDFLIKTNRNNMYSSLKNIASGGELSRVLLAIKKILTFTDPRLYIFDEIDQGTGGDTAHKIAKLLKKISVNSQIIVITHLVQVASRADRHFYVDKKTLSDDTVSEIRVLDEREREFELSRMIGDKNMDQTKNYIKSLLK
jgi:DNA repair protein RecN (Recombination protein N)